MGTVASNTFCALPPLILHPFADPDGPNKLLESSRVSTLLQGMTLATSQRNELERRLLDGRYCEIRMLYYVGKDVNRWIDQCMEVVERMPELAQSGISRHMFAHLLIDDTPKAVRDKLKQWGVADYRAIFTRGLGLNAVFAETPSRDAITDDFVRNYYRFADRMFLSLYPNRADALEGVSFHFDLYASGEYSKLLEQEWGTDFGASA